LVIQYFNQQL